MSILHTSNNSVSKRGKIHYNQPTTSNSGKSPSSCFVMSILLTLLGLIICGLMNVDTLRIIVASINGG